MCDTPKRTHYLDGRKKTIFLDGGISAGKSTATQQLGDERLEAGDTRVFFECGHGDGVLEVYLSDQQKLSGMFQIHMLEGCRYRDALSLKEPADCLTIVDRSKTGNAVFALANHALLGTSATDPRALVDKSFDNSPIGLKEYALYKVVYEQAMQGSSGPFAHGDLNVYLHVTAITTIERCKRRSVEAEKASYDVPYFEKLECAAMVAILANLSRPDPFPQLILDWSDEYGTMDNFHRILRTYLEHQDEMERFKCEHTTPINTLAHAVVLSRWPFDYEHDDPSWYQAVLDFSHCRTELEFFSYENVLLLFSHLCHRIDYDRYRKSVFVRVPPCLTASPFNGTFALTIQ